MSCHKRAIGSFIYLLGPFVQKVGVEKLFLKKRERATCPTGEESRRTRVQVTQMPMLSYSPRGIASAQWKNTEL